MRAADWLNWSNEDFVRAYAPHAAVRRVKAASPQHDRRRGSGFSLPASSVAQIATPGKPQTHNKGQAQQMTRREILQALMTTDPNQIVTWNERRITVAEVIGHLLRRRGDRSPTAGATGPGAARTGESGTLARRDQFPQSIQI